MEYSRSTKLTDMATEMSKCHVWKIANLQQYS